MLNPPDVPSQQDPDLTFASRNPTKVVHPSRVHPGAKLSDAQKISAASKHKINKENANALKVEIDAFFDLRDTEITQLAKKFSKSEVKIKQLLSNETNYQKTCAPSLWNVLVHAKDSDILSLQDHDHGDRLNLAQIQKLVDDDADMQHLSKTRQKEYINDLQAHRDSKTMGACTSNVAAAVDCCTSIARVSLEIRNLLEHTGVCAFVFFICTHIHDSAIPAWADSDDATAFVSEGANGLLTKFKQWACIMKTTDNDHPLAGGVQENLQSMRSDCMCLIINGLCLILNLSNIRMCYKNYEWDIVTKHKAEIIGWPTTIKFANPSEIGTVEEIQKLCQVLKVGECKWIIQS
ncbi:hypothetical protein L208DRAFT_1329741 [Tricholoma matsutake]|nr:hypothetical protein L208DRAFT_1329741 [Tricholoma matsutake 945]